MSRWLLPILASALFDACHQTLTRAEEDRANARRRCLLQISSGVREEHAVRCAEWFIARQGYTDAAAVDTGAVVAEGIEWTASLAERLDRRRGSLQPRAFGLCVKPDGSFDVAFHDRDSQYARGVTMDAQYGSLRVQHSNFNAEAVVKRLHGCRPLSGTSPG